MGKINLRAVAMGCLADWAGTAAFGLVFGLIAVSIETSRGMRIEQAADFLQRWFMTPSGTIFSTLFGLGFTCLGGYVATKMARQETLWNSILVGGIAVLAGLPFLPHTAVYITVLSLALSLTAAVIGGLLYSKKFRF
jgi:hypothetical protein